MEQNLFLVFLSETVGSFFLLLLGAGVVANVALKGTKGNGGGFLLVNFGWGLAVFAGVIVSGYSGAQLNPAVTIGLIMRDAVSGTDIDFAMYAVSVLGQIVGAFLGAVGAWLAYKDHFDAEEDAATKLGVFSTGPGIRNKGMNFITEAIATFVLVFVVIGFGFNGDASGLAALGALPVALLVLGIGASLGGPTGYAINPTRDLMPRLAHAILPIKGKGDSDWGYAWVPVFGPLFGGAVAGLTAPFLIAAGVAA
ncbi:MIP/aquaporin family protein [Humidisolicoccus flavus]|uniref:MIP/aquaporin family protein n=1 Tax=Humidisolicoccus flavus TaxID=3111414 RepID=UPI00324B782A